MHCSIEHGGFEHELHAILGDDAERMTIALRGEAAEVALGEAQAVLAMVQDDERRGRLADLVAAVAGGRARRRRGAGARGADRARSHDGPHPQRLRAGGRAGRAEDVPPAARAGASCRESAREVTRGARRARGQDARARSPCSRRARARSSSRSRVEGLELSVQARPRRRAHPLGRRLMPSRTTSPASTSTRPPLPRRRRRRDGAREGRRAARRAAPTSIVAPASTSPRCSTASGSSSSRPATQGERASTRDASERRIFCNVADVPELCSFILPGAAPPRRRSRSRSRPAARRRRSRSGCATASPRRSASSTSSSRGSCARLARG